MNPKCVLFDLDNTLTHRRDSITQFAYQFWTTFQSNLNGVDISKLETIIQHCDGGGYCPKEEMFRILSTELPWTESTSPETIKDFWYSVSPTCMQPRMGLETVLETLYIQQIPMGIITNGQTAVQNATIDALGIRHYFDIILISEEVAIRKPDRRIFDMALERLSMECDLTWFVGDNPTSDMIGARDAGLVPVWLSDGRVWDNSLPLPHYQIEELPALLDILGIRTES